MTTSSGRIPKYRRKAVGKGTYARVTLTDVDTGERRDVTLGERGSPTSRQAYLDAISEWESAGRKLLSGPDKSRRERKRRFTVGATVTDLVLAYARWSRTRGYSPSHQSALNTMLRRLRLAYGDKSTASFAPMDLKAMRATFVSGDPNADPKRISACSRKVANGRNSARAVTCFVRTWWIGVRRIHGRPTFS